MAMVNKPTCLTQAFRRLFPPNPRISWSTTPPDFSSLDLNRCARKARAKTRDFSYAKRRKILVGPEGVEKQHTEAACPTLNGEDRSKLNMASSASLSNECIGRASSTGTTRVSSKWYCIPAVT